MIAGSLIVRFLQEGLGLVRYSEPRFHRIQSTPAIVQDLPGRGAGLQDVWGSPHRLPFPDRAVLFVFQRDAQTLQAVAQSIGQRPEFFRADPLPDVDHEFHQPCQESFGV